MSRCLREHQLACSSEFAIEFLSSCCKLSQLQLLDIVCMMFEEAEREKTHNEIANESCGPFFQHKGLKVRFVCSGVRVNEGNIALDA